MMNKKPQTIQGFLTPARLLTGLQKNSKHNSKGSKSPNVRSNLKEVTMNSNVNSQNQSMFNMSRDLQRQFLTYTSRNAHTAQINLSRLTGENLDSSLTQLAANRKYESEIPFSYNGEESRINTIDPYRRANVLIAQRANVPITQESQMFQSKQRAVQQINNRKSDTQRSRHGGQTSSLNNQRLKANPTANFRQTLLQPYLTENPGSIIQQKTMSNTQAITSQCYQLIRKLSKIKQTLQLQISELQVLLDNTSKYMDNMQDQFQKIKDEILSYTAKCLDNAFNQYKQNMVQWQKYQDFQRKSLFTLSQINQCIYNQQQRLSQDMKPSHKQMTAVARQLQKRIQCYAPFVEEIKEIHQQCARMRPTLTGDGVQQFEKGLAVLCEF